jgi:hypothetical protein
MGLRGTDVAREASDIILLYKQLRRHHLHPDRQRDGLSQQTPECRSLSAPAQALDHDRPAAGGAVNPIGALHTLLQPAFTGGPLQLWHGG